MNSKKTMTLNLTEAEMDALESLSAAKDVSKTAIVRQALRLYQLINVRLELGEKLFLESVDPKDKKELVVL
jgi:hypothetical protein